MKKRKRLLIAAFVVYLAAAVWLLFMCHAASDMPFSEYVRQNTNFIPLFSFYVLYTTPYISYRVLVPFCVNLFGNLDLFPVGRAAADARQTLQRRKTLLYFDGVRDNCRRTVAARSQGRHLRYRGLHT